MRNETSAVTPTEAQRIAHLTDPNHIFDGSGVFPFDLAAVDDRQHVQRSAPDFNDPNRVFDSMIPWPVVEVEKSANPGPRELMNRLTGNRDEPTSNGTPGRPPKPGSALDNFDPKNPQTILDFAGETIRAGSVLTLKLGDGSIQVLALTGDVSFTEIATYPPTETPIDETLRA